MTDLHDQKFTLHRFDGPLFDPNLQGVMYADKGYVRISAEGHPEHAGDHVVGGGGDLGEASVGDLSDIDLTTTAPVSGDTLVFDGTVFAPQTAGTPNLAVASVGDLSDIDLTTVAPQPGDALTWNGSAFMPFSSATPRSVPITWNLSSNTVAWTDNLTQFTIDAPGTIPMYAIIHMVSGSVPDVAPDIQIVTTESTPKTLFDSATFGGGEDYMTQLTADGTAGTTVMIPLTGSPITEAGSNINVRYRPGTGETNSQHAIANITIALG